MARDSNVKGEVRQTTLGRVYFNEILPEDFGHIEDVMGKKRLGKVLASIFEKYGSEITAQVADEVKDIALEYATLGAVSTGMTDYFEVTKMDGIIKEGEGRAAKISGEQYEQGLITDDERYSLTVAKLARASTKKCWKCCKAAWLPKILALLSCLTLVRAVTLVTSNLRTL